MLRKKLSLTLCLLIISYLSLNTLNAHAAPRQTPWSEWVAGVRAEAISKGIRPALFDEVFAKIKKPNPRVLAYDRNQPEKRLTFLKYRNTRADKYRILIGRRKLKKYKSLLDQIGRQYGVSPCFITSLWGLETSYGSFMGKFPVIQSLATLAYDTRRAAFFRKQLIYALHILNGGHVKNKDFKGEWAGASGHPQFLPSSWHNYAVDYDQDGRRDIWRTLPDVFASIANYLKQNGWQPNEPWAIAVKVPKAVKDQGMINSKKRLSLADWQSMGITTLSGQPWPHDRRLSAELIRPYGGPDMLTFNNFRVIMKWNRSNYYAGTVGYLAEQICGRPLY